MTGFIILNSPIENSTGIRRVRRGVRGFENPILLHFFLLNACLSERLVLYEDTPTLHLGN